jgi:hypothetical protein
LPFAVELVSDSQLTRRWKMEKIEELLMTLADPNVPLLEKQE